MGVGPGFDLGRVVSVNQIVRSGLRTGATSVSDEGSGQDIGPLHCRASSNPTRRYISWPYSLLPWEIPRSAPKTSPPKYSILDSAYSWRRKGDGHRRESQLRSTQLLQFQRYSFTNRSSILSRIKANKVPSFNLRMTWQGIWCSNPSPAPKRSKRWGIGWPSCFRGSTGPTLRSSLRSTRYNIYVYSIFQACEKLLSSSLTLVSATVDGWLLLRECREDLLFLWRCVLFVFSAFTLDVFFPSFWYAFF